MQGPISCITCHLRWLHCALIVTSIPAGLLFGVPCIVALTFVRCALLHSNDPCPPSAVQHALFSGIDPCLLATVWVAGAHYFCETLDLSRPFPSDSPVTQPSWEFVWNRWLSTGFRTAGLDFVCPQLLQVSAHQWQGSHPRWSQGTH